MTALELSRVEQGRVYTSLCTAMHVPDQIETQRLAAFEARAYAFAYLQPYDFLQSYMLGDVLEEHLHQIGADLYAVSLDAVAELAMCDTDTVKHALRLLGCFKCPVRGRCVYTNDSTGRTAIIEIPPAALDGWRSLDW